jgi:hypothetical protein
MKMHMMGFKLTNTGLQMIWTLSSRYGRPIFPAIIHPFGKNNLKLTTWII